MANPNDFDIEVEYDTRRRQNERIAKLERVCEDLEARIEALEENVTPPEQKWSLRSDRQGW